jgi:hypothetical protein
MTGQSIYVIRSEPDFTNGDQPNVRLQKVP